MGLEKEFSEPNVKIGVFECFGIVHEQDPATRDVWTHQEHYLPLIKDTPADAKTIVPEAELADEDLGQLIMSVAGALAWLILTIQAIGICRMPPATDKCSQHGACPPRQPALALAASPLKEAWSLVQASQSASPRHDAPR